MMSHVNVGILMICVGQAVEKQQINKRSIILPAQLAVGQLVATSSNLKTAYGNKDLRSIKDVALALVDSLPVIGDISHLFQNSQNSFDIIGALTTVNNNLKTLSEYIKNIETQVDEIVNVIELSVIKNQFANAKREIVNCFQNFLIFVKIPSSQANQDRVESCYSKFAYVRQIGSLLLNQVLTIQQNSLFDQIIKITGYCDWEELNDVFRFLLGEYIKGCTALTASEVLKYGNDSTTYKDECQSTLLATSFTLTKMFDKCKIEPCLNYQKAMINILKKDDAANITSRLQATFPWYSTVLVVLNKTSSLGVALYNIESFNYLTLTSRGFVYRVLIWSAYNNTLKSGPDQYGIEFNENEVESIYNGMNLIQNTTNERIVLDGYHENLSKPNVVCNHNVNIDSDDIENDSNDIEDFLTNNQDITVSLPGYAIAIIIGGLAILVLIGLCICACMCRG
ncbi:uncharacterized protein [Mytilus edulis]|uniref:uncharacterized protein n=1 Tax=Mytilus edulis TaxID=6550 RepID=UPI0039EFDE58